MKTIFSSAFLLIATALPTVSAEVNTKLSDVHLCCGACTRAVQTAVGKVPGATATVDQEAGTVSLAGADLATVQKAADALVEVGYFGKSSNADVKVVEKSGVKGAKVKSLKLEGVHLCCRTCVTAVDTALKTVPGVEKHTAERNAKTFEITGDFNDKEVITALNKAGLTGQIPKE
jgi:copper chaperone CopZ